MERLIQHIADVKEEELGLKEFQLVVLTALLELVQQQQNLQNTVEALVKENTKMISQDVKGFVEEFSDDESSQEEEMEENPGAIGGKSTNGYKRLKEVCREEDQAGKKQSRFKDVDDKTGEKSIKKEKFGDYLWKRRIPASKFGKIVKAQGNRTGQDFAKEILEFNSTQDTEATLHGKKHENDAKLKLEQVLGKEVEEPKKVVDKENKYLVCIPDGLVDHDKLVEIKCPFKCKDSTILELAKTDPNFCLGLTPDGKLKLKLDHDYYFQVQGELHLTRRSLCYFVVWSPTEFQYQVIQRDDDFWNEKMFPFLQQFYQTHILEDKWKIPDISEIQRSLQMKSLLNKLQTTKTKQGSIEKETRGQGSNPLWIKERKERLTASNFGRVAKMKPSTSCQNTVISILYPEKMDNIEAIKYGKENEKNAIEELNKLLSKENLHITDCGLFVDIQRGFLAASPDGMVARDALVEVKCPLKCSHNDMGELAVSDSSFCLEKIPGQDKMRLKKNHNYYYQIQGQLHIANRSKCYFMVWSPNCHHMEIIPYDAEFWEEVEEILEQFYMQCMLPEIVDPRAPRGLPVREPDYITDAQQLKNLKI